jgi:hypothetical protein
VPRVTVYGVVAPGVIVSDGSIVGVVLGSSVAVGGMSVGVSVGVSVAVGSSVGVALGVAVAVGGMTTGISPICTSSSRHDAADPLLCASIGASHVKRSQIVRPRYALRSTVAVVQSILGAMPAALCQFCPSRLSSICAAPCGACNSERSINVG